VIRVVLADDHALVRDGLRAVLAREPDIQVVGEAADGRDALRVVETAKPDVAVLDLSMPLLNGLDVARQLVAQERGPRAILITMHAEDRYVLDALRAGVRGYVLKKQAAADLVRAIREVAEGRVYLSPGVGAAVADAIRTGGPAPDERLTPREREVLQLVAEGKTKKEIAAILKVSVKTADAHRTHLMQKLDIHDIAGLTRCALRLGLIHG
jgi:two-component system, NarL family, response regulator NreC